MPTHIEERTITGTLEETNTWKQALNTVTGGGTPAVESKDDYQTFRWAMVKNLKRIDKAIEALRLDAKSEHERILAKHCGSVNRFHEYLSEAKTCMAPFSKYLLPTGVYELPGQVRARFQKTQNELSQKYPDVDKNYKIEFGQFDFDKVKKILMEHDFSEERINSQFEKVKDLKEKNKQRTLF
jgi:hypothetical protein